MKPAPPVTRIDPALTRTGVRGRRTVNRQPPVLVADADLAAVGLDHPPGDGQAQAGAAPARRAGGLAPEGDVEDPVEVDVGDASAGVDAPTRRRAAPSIPASTIRSRRRACGGWRSPAGCAGPGPPRRPTAPAPGRGALERPSRRTPLARATGTAPARASDTRSDSDTFSICRPSTPAWVRDSSKRSSTRPARRSTSTTRLMVVAGHGGRVGDDAVLQRLGHRPDGGQGRPQVMRHPGHQLAPGGLQGPLPGAGLRPGRLTSRPAPGRGAASSRVIGSRSAPLAPPDPASPAPMRRATSTGSRLARSTRPPEHEGGGRCPPCRQRPGRPRAPARSWAETNMAVAGGPGAGGHGQPPRSAPPTTARRAPVAAPQGRQPARRRQRRARGQRRPGSRRRRTAARPSRQETATPARAAVPTTRSRQRPARSWVEPVADAPDGLEWAGDDGSASTFSRRRRMWTVTVEVSPYV